jgi:hypothetical protein
MYSFILAALLLWLCDAADTVSAGVAATTTSSTWFASPAATRTSVAGCWPVTRLMGLCRHNVNSSSFLWRWLLHTAMASAHSAL